MLSVWFVSTCLLVAVAGDVRTGVLPDVRSQTPKIYYLHIKSDIRFRFATTVVTSKIVNPAAQAQQATFQVTLPNEAFITNFTLTVGNDTYVGDVKGKKEARQEYDSAVAQGNTAAHISVRPRETNMFNIAVNLAAEQNLTFELRYQELLQRKLGSYNHVIYVKAGEPVLDMRIDVDIFESRAITKLHVPPIRNDILTDIDITAQNEVAIIDHVSDRRVHIRYEPSMEQQTSEGDPEGLDGQFRVTYDVDRQTDGGDILMVNGYFVHFFAPSGLEPRPKNVVFILDKSGSMSGAKIRQLKEAMVTILSQIEPVDNFNILTFDGAVTMWTNDELVSASQSNIEEAKAYVNAIRANGGTNIQEAMLDGISLLERRFDDTRSSVIIFLTDGEPTVGERSPTRILAKVAARNEYRIPVFSLAFGRNADYNLVKRLASQNNGFGRKIYEDSDADLQISKFFSEVSTVLLQNVTFSYLDGSVDRKTLIFTHRQLTRGSEIVVSGRISGEISNDLQPHITAQGYNGLISLHVPDTALTTQLNITHNSDVYSITEKLWAYLTVKQWLKQMDAATDEIEQENWKQNITTMALKYNFVTSLTSMVVTLPDELQVSPIQLEGDDLDIEDESVGSRRSHGHGQASYSRVQYSKHGTQRKHQRNRQRNKSRMSPSYDLPYIRHDVGIMQARVPLLMPPSLMDVATHTPQSTTTSTIGQATTMLTPQPTTSNIIQRATTTRTIRQTTTPAAEVITKTPNKRKLSKMIRPRTKASDYTLVAVAGVKLPLCFKNPGDKSVDTATMYNLTMDTDTGMSVSVGYTFHGTGKRMRTRITRIRITTLNATTEIIPGFRIEHGVRQQTSTYSQLGGNGPNLKWEVVNKNNKITLLADFTRNTNQNIEGSLIIPVQGEVREKRQPRRNRTKAKLILKAKRKGVMKTLKSRVKFSKPMQCWVTKTKLMLNV